MIINQTGGGTQPTGTTQITSNGTHNVAGYEFADVAVPTTAPAIYLEKYNDNGTLKPSGASLIDLTGITNLDERALSYQYAGATFPANTNVDFSSITSMGKYACTHMFDGCIGIESIDLSGLTSGVEHSCSYMFQGCTNLTNMDLSNLKLEGTSICQGMFASCIGLTGLLDFSTKTKISGQNACGSMFNGCTGLTSVDLSNIKIISGNSACVYMFRDCTGLTSANLGSLVYVYDNSACSNMFSNCINLTNVDLSNLMWTPAGLGNMFSGCTNLININLSNYIKCSTCSSMFSGCTNLVSVDLSYLTHMVESGGNKMFENCTSLTSVNISKLTKFSTTSSPLGQMFKGCTSLTSLSFNGLPYTATNLNSAFSNMLQGVTGCTVHFPADWQTAMSSWSNVTNGFGGTNTTVLWDLPSVTTLDLNHAKKLIETDGIPGYTALFDGLASNNYFPNITLFDIRTIESVSCGRSFAKIFQNSTNLTSIDLSGLKVIDSTGGGSDSAAFSYAFDGCTGLTGSINLSSLETITQSYACSYMFRNCTGLTSIDLSSLTTVSGNSACSYMFSGCTGLTVLNFPKLTTVSAASVFSNMLANTSGVTVHFPSNLTTSITASTLGGTGTTVLYDLPAA